MIQLQTISQRGFIRGVNAAVNRFTQPKGTVPSAQNLLLTRRGSFVTMDGLSSAVIQPGIAGLTNNGFFVITSMVDVRNELLNAPIMAGLVTGGGVFLGVPPTPTLADAVQNSATIQTVVNNGAVRINALATVTVTASPTIPFALGQLVNVGGVTDATFDGVQAICSVGPLYDTNQNPLQFSYVSNFLDSRSGGGTVGTGNLTPAQQYFYKIVALDASGATFQTQFPSIDGVNLGSSGPSGEASHTLGAAKNAITLSWIAARDAAGYLVYRSTTTGTETLVSTFIPNLIPAGGPTGTTQLTWTDLGWAGNGASPPAGGTSRTSLLVAIGPNNQFIYSGAQIVASYPWANLSRPAEPPLGAYDSTPPSGIQTYSDAWTPLGGTQGGLSPIPQFVPMTGQLIVCLGNGYPAQLLTGQSVAQISSTFVQAIPAFQANAFYATGELVVPNASPQTGFYYKVIQQGTSSAEPAAWPAVLNGVVTSGQAQFEAAGKATSGGTNVNGIPGPPPPGAAHGVNYAGFLWLGNTWPVNHPNGIDGPSAIRMSDLNNPTSWNPVNTAFLGKDDGTQIMGFAQFTIAESGIIPTGSLVVFKEYSTYQITGVFGSSNFTIQQAQTNLGCIAPRTIQFVPGYGIVRLSHLGWAVFDGVRDRLISEEIRPFIFSDPSTVNDYISQPLDWGFAWKCQAAQTAVPALYVALYSGLGTAGKLTYGLAYDLVLRAWTNIQWPTEVRALYQQTAMLPVPVTYISDTFGHIQTWQTGAELHTIYSGNSANTQIPVAWSVRTPEVVAPTPSGRMYLRRLIASAKNRSGTTGGVPNYTIPTATFQFNGANDLTLPVLYKAWEPLPQLASLNQYISVEFDVGILPMIATQANCTIAGTGRFEIDAIDWYVQPKPTGVPLTIT